VLSRECALIFLDELKNLNILIDSLENLEEIKCIESCVKELKEG
jgi:hypothetical protein